MSNAHDELSQTWNIIQSFLFPMLEESLGSLSEKEQQLVTILELIRIEEHIRSYYGVTGRPLKNRGTIARAFVAKMVYKIP
ncbi:MAG: hypothetical protein Q9M14_08720, partial [Mariprofundaceae bacterium]|nr:hypothetical protein [Mariprofundaceae bacterium]